MHHIAREDGIISHLSLIFRRYWMVVLAFAASFTSIVSYVFLSADNLYVCEMEFVPPDFSMASPLLRNAALVPGSASDLERTYSYLQSFSLRQELIDTFQLYAYYGLERISNPRRRARKLEALLRENIQVRITKNATILVQVYDKSPDFAYRLMLFLRRKVEQFSREIIGMEQALAEKDRQLRMLMKEIQALETALSELRVKYRIIIGGGERHRGTPVLPTPEAFAHYDRVLSMENRLVRLQETYANLVEEKGRREDLVRVYSTPIFIIQPPQKPLYPVNINPFLVIGVAFGGSFLVGAALLLYAYRLGLIGSKRVSPEPFSVPS